MKLNNKNSFRIFSLLVLLMFISCSDESEDLFMAKFDGKSFMSTEKGQINHWEKQLINFDTVFLDFYTEEDQECWERDFGNYRMIENFQYSAVFKNDVGAKDILIVTMREEGGLRIQHEGFDAIFEAIRTSDYCINDYQ